MDFSFLKKLSQKEEKKEYFLALLCKPFSVSAILFEQVNGRLVILSFKEKLIDHSVDQIEADQLVAVCDEVVSYVEQQLPAGALLHKTIFALPYDFVEEGKIKKEHLAKFKKVCDDLELVPIGFIVTIEAIVHSLQKKEGVPITAIFIELAKHTLFLYLVRAGNVIEIHQADYSESLAKTVESVLKSVHSFEVLPSRIVLLDYEGIDNVQQEFLSFPWTKDLPFLHLPQVITLEKGFENEAVINGVASQMGFEVIGAKVSSPDEAVVEKKVEEEEFQPAVEPSDFGFVKEQDVRQLEQEDNKKHLEEETQEPKITEAISGKVDDPFEEESLPADAAYHTPQKAQATQSFDFLSHFKAMVPIPASVFKNPRLVFIPIILVLVLGGFIYFYYNFILSSEVILFLAKKTIDKDTEVSLISDSATDPSKQIIKMDVIAIEQEKTLSADTTGKKETGEKAKGEVTLYNKTEDKKTFDKGTVIIGPNKLEFELSDSATVASTSAFSTNFSNAKVKAVAGKLGSEYNIPSASNFTIKNIASSQVFAKNDSAFSGGTKEEIQVVSEQDLSDLETQLIDDLKKSALEQLKGKASGENVLLPSVLTYEFAKKKFNKKVNDEAKKVTLDATVSFKAGSYSESELDEFMKTITESAVPGDFEFVDGASDAKLTDITIDKNKKVSAILKMKAVYIPTIDEEDIVKEVSGKNISQAEEITGDIKNISDSKVIFKNQLPFLPNILPFNTKNIHIIINTDD